MRSKRLDRQGDGEGVPGDPHSTGGLTSSYNRDYSRLLRKFKPQSRPSILWP